MWHNRECQVHSLHALYSVPVYFSEGLSAGVRYGHRHKRSSGLTGVECVHVCGLQDVGRQVRWHLLHRLCQRDQTYSELQDALPSNLVAHHQAFDQVCCVTLSNTLVTLCTVQKLCCVQKHA